MGIKTDDCLTAALCLEAHAMIDVVDQAQGRHLRRRRRGRYRDK